MDPTLNRVNRNGVVSAVRRKDRDCSAFGEGVDGGLVGVRVASFAGLGERLESARGRSLVGMESVKTQGSLRAVHVLVSAFDVGPAKEWSAEAHVLRRRTDLKCSVTAAHLSPDVPTMLSSSTIPRRRCVAVRSRQHRLGPGELGERITHEVKEDKANDAELLVALDRSGGESGRVCFKLGEGVSCGRAGGGPGESLARPYSHSPLPIMASWRGGWAAIVEAGTCQRRRKREKERRGNIGELAARPAQPYLNVIYAGPFYVVI